MRKVNRGWLSGIGGIIGVLLLLALLYGSREAAKPASPASPSAGPRATKQAVRVLAGSPRITGTVRNEHGPVAGVRVSASRVERVKMADDVDFAMLIPGPVPFPESPQAAGLLEKQSHPMRWKDGPPKVATFEQLPGGRYTLFAMGRNSHQLHREELEVPAVGEHSRDVRAVWRPLGP
ncbi:hypothetical protein G4177_07085 [Corallococcus sp. ZKHCc1 1396]|uniref:DUF4198 domain-containing protein n=1 Tax=Corallococcus soli TaxID=2710757 RepID=A0ABR9PJ86_9BACT|nr:hypothetical protein [Corallococcus soli]MBE4747940.1 hypothetical protein [Corallococcus soli]